MVVLITGKTLNLLEGIKGLVRPLGRLRRHHSFSSQVDLHGVCSSRSRLQELNAKTLSRDPFTEASDGVWQLLVFVLLKTGRLKLRSLWPAPADVASSSINAPLSLAAELREEGRCGWRE